MKLLSTLLVMVTFPMYLLAQERLEIARYVPDSVRYQLPAGVNLAHVPLLLYSKDNAVGYLFLVTTGDTVGYAIGEEGLFGYSKPIEAFLIKRGQTGKIHRYLIDSFENEVTAVSIKSIFLVDADKKPGKELAIITSNFSDVSLRRGEIYRTHLYSLNVRGIFAKNNFYIDGGCYCERPDGAIEKPDISTAASVRKYLSEKQKKAISDN